jgi:hypothetical protein
MMRNLYSNGLFRFLLVCSALVNILLAIVLLKKYGLI